MNKYICRRACEINTCPYHYTNLEYEIPADMKVHVVHLEGNPLFCKKNDWNDNQVEEKESD